jgi:GntR family transcriptional regulator of vanillate catabolism
MRRFPTVVRYPGYVSTGRASRHRGRTTGGTQRRSGERLVDGITQELRELILDHQVAPGTVLLQTEWAEKLQVSRTPLREAFRILEQDGLVEVSNGNRTVRVVDFSGPELRDLLQVREVVDGLAAKLLATRGMSADVEDTLVNHLEAMEESSNPFEPAVWFAAHLGFHLHIAESCGNSRMSQQLGLIKITSFALRFYLSSLTAGGEELEQFLDVAARHHRTIYDAIRSGNGDLAEMAASQYIRATIKLGLLGRSDPSVPSRAG